MQDKENPCKKNKNRKSNYLGSDKVSVKIARKHGSQKVVDSLKVMKEKTVKEEFYTVKKAVLQKKK